MICPDWQRPGQPVPPPRASLRLLSAKGPSLPLCFADGFESLVQERMWLCFGSYSGSVLLVPRWASRGPRRPGSFLGLCGRLPPGPRVVRPARTSVSRLHVCSGHRPVLPRKGCPRSLSLLPASFLTPVTSIVSSSQALQNRSALSTSEYFLFVYTIFRLPIWFYLKKKKTLIL